MNNGLGISCEQLVIDYDLVRMCLRVREGINFSDDALAVDAIKRVGHGGNYLTDEHTLEWLLEGDEHFYPKTFNFNGPGSKTALERAHEVVEKMLSEATPLFDDRMIDEVDRYIDDKISYAGRSL